MMYLDVGHQTNWRENLMNTKKLLLSLVAALSLVGTVAPTVSAAPQPPVEYGKLTDSQAQAETARLAGEYARVNADKKTAEQLVISREAALKTEQDQLAKDEAAQDELAANKAYQDAKKAISDTHVAATKAANDTFKTAVDGLDTAITNAQAAQTRAATHTQAAADLATAEAEAEPNAAHVEALRAELSAADAAIATSNAAVTAAQNAKAEALPGLQATLNEAIAEADRVRDVATQTLEYDNNTGDAYKQDPTLVALKKEVTAATATEATATAAGALLLVPKFRKK